MTEKLPAGEERIANLIAPFFKDPINIPCPYCEAAKAIINAGYKSPGELEVEVDKLTVSDRLYWRDVYTAHNLDGDIFEAGKKAQLQHDKKQLLDLIGGKENENHQRNETEP
jgi:hypothetical protein